MATNHTCEIEVRNNFGGPANVELTHRYGNHPVESLRWESVADNGVGSPPLTVNYQTGPFTDFDRWHVDVTVLSGPNQGRWENSGFKECYLKDIDANNVHTFDVSPGSGGFKVNLMSSSCTDKLEKVT